MDSLSSLTNAVMVLGTLADAAEGVVIPLG